MAMVHERDMVETPSIPQAVAQWIRLQAAGADAGADALAAAAEAVQCRLRAGLTVFLGPTGFDSLWARAMHLEQRTSPPRVAAGMPPLALPDDWWAAVRGRTAG